MLFVHVAQYFLGAGDIFGVADLEPEFAGDAHESVVGGETRNHLAQVLFTVLPDCRFVIEDTVVEHEHAGGDQVGFRPFRLLLYLGDASGSVERYDAETGRVFRAGE